MSIARPPLSPEAQAELKALKAQILVLHSEDGKIFHRLSLRRTIGSLGAILVVTHCGLDSRHTRLEVASLETAEAAGLRPCLTCYPERKP